MLTKNLKGKIEKIKLEKVEGTNKINQIIIRQQEIEETLNFILQQLKTGVCRRDKY